MSSRAAAWSRPGPMPAWPARAVSMRAWPSSRTWISPRRRRSEAFLPAGARPVDPGLPADGLLPAGADHHALALRTDRYGDQRNGQAGRRHAVLLAQPRGAGGYLPPADPRPRL